MGGGSRPLAVGLDRIAAALAVLIALIAVGAAVARRERSLALPAALFTGGLAVRAVALAVAPGDDPRRPVLAASFAVRAVAMVLLAAALVWTLSRTPRAIAALRRVVRQGSGSFQAALARGTGDRSLRVAFAASDSGGWIDAEGHPFAVPDRRALHVIAREGRPIAAVVHDPQGLDGAALEHEIGPAAQLALENERLRANARAEARELEASRVRIVETGDAERRRLERDLHDGAQQRLVGLSMALALARGADAADVERVHALEAAGGQLQAAIVELREIAHGIHPVELTDEGLAAALETLADRATVPGRRWTPCRPAAPGRSRDCRLHARRRGRRAGRPAWRRAKLDRRRAPRRGRADRGGPRSAGPAPRARSERSWTSPIASTRCGGTLTIDDAGGVRVRAELPCA